MKIGIIVAMEKEMAHLQALIEGAVVEEYLGKTFVCGRIGEKEVVMQQCGIGKVNAAIGTMEMIYHYSPDLIVSSGCAGGADTNLKVTDVVVGTTYTFHDVYCGSEVAYGQMVGMPVCYHADERLVKTALNLGNDVRVHAGMIVSGDWFVDSKDKMREILSHFPDATAVDMESCAIAQTCYLCHVPFVSFRVISDIPLLDTDASQYYDFWTRVAEGSFQVTKSFLMAIDATAAVEEE
jgi:adenosylhomocysteine nucleosidase